jgi:hypothetical protein
MSAETVDQKERESRRSERPRRSQRDDHDDRDDRDDDDRPRRRRVEEEPTPVVSGRFLIAAGLVLAMVVIPLSQLGGWLEPKDPTVPQPSTWTVGSRATVAITLITADYNLLSCAHDKTYKSPEGTSPPVEYHCANKSESEPWPRDPSRPLDDNKLNVIQPYRTWLNNQLILVGGLWATPQLAYRLHAEPAAGIDKDKLARFVVECDVTFIGKMDGVKLRWGPGQWTAPDMAPMLAHPNSCKITEQ